MEPRLKYFCEEFHGWIIRIGPDAIQRPDPYIWAFPLSDDGEFVGVSTQSITSEAKRVATDAAGALGFQDPRWQHKEKVIMANQSLAAKHGGKPGPQADQAQVIAVVEHYVAEMKAGKMKIEHISEIDLGGGRWVRTFVINGDK